MRVWIEVNPAEDPSSRRTFAREMPAFSAAEKATDRAVGRVMRIFDLAVFNAWPISSTPYAGDAPLTRPPALMVANTATGYQMVLVLNRETVSPGLRPY